VNLPAVYRVDERIEEYPGTFTLRISARDTPATAQFAPGQFNMLYVFGTGEVPISLSGPPIPDGTGYIHTVRALGPTTQALERLRPGDSLGLRGPFGSTWPLAASVGRHLLVIAGGLGLAPLRPVLYSLVTPGLQSLSERPARASLFYGARTPAEMLYRDELQQWSRIIAVETTVDSAGPEWRGHVGVVTSLLAEADIVPAETVAFICGPEVMMRFAIQELRRRGIADSAIYLSMERNMKCATGHCGHCQWGPKFICRDGPVFCYADIAAWFAIREL